jgi:hypothetical protein
MDDDLFQSLGGSLMKDLLADLQGDDEGGWLSLEQLEKELSQLDNSAPDHHHHHAYQQLPPAAMTAASMVVGGHGQSSVVGGGLLGSVTVTKQPSADAWKESLQKFTALSLDQDFLAADTVRKQQATALLPPGFLAEAQDYDATEKVLMKPPPGLLGATTTRTSTTTTSSSEQELATSLASALLQPSPADDVPPPIPGSKPLPKTPANSISTGPPRKLPTKTPRNSVIIASVQEAQDIATYNQEDDDDDEDFIPIMQNTNLAVPNPNASAPASAQGMAMPLPPHHMPQMQHTMHPPGHPGMVMSQQQQPQQHYGPMMAPSPGMHPQQQQGMLGGGVPVAMRMPGGPAWQQPQQPQLQRPQPPPPMRPVFCNPHPNAPPIPANALESRLMKSRDISYIVHSILKPILTMGISEYDYDIQLLYRQSGGRPAGPLLFRGSVNNNNNAAVVQDGNAPTNTNTPLYQVIQQEMVSREQKAKEWSTKNAALGHFQKASIARPRALIASSVAMTSADNPAKSEQKQRARLWKARIYCDQAHQAYQQVVDIWAKAAPGSVPPSVQAPLIRLLKCLGIAVQVQVIAKEAARNGGGGTAAAAADEGDFKVDPLVLELFLKLSKGRVLLARIIEQALLPPSAVQAMLPSTLDILYKTPPAAAQGGGDLTDERCFRALAVVIQTLPALSGDSLLQCAQVVKTNSEVALSTTCRMECLHALLQRGSVMASGPVPEGFAGAWKATEDSVMAILSGK